VSHRLFSRSLSAKARQAGSRPGSPGSRERHTSGFRDSNRPDDDFAFSQSLSALSALTDVSLAAEIALDVALYELLQQACAAAVATSGAIGLLQGGEIVCRARTGDSAPDLGMRLDWHSKLSAACFQTKGCQRCDDAQADPRVDGELCQRLGIRSILLIPIMRGQELIGMLQVLSPLPNAFTDHEAEVLSMFSQQVVDKLERSEQVRASAGKPNLVPEPRSLENWDPAIPGGTQQEKESVGAVKARDLSTDVLLVSLVLLAATLGWMLDRAEWHEHNANRARAQLSQGQSGTPAADSSSNPTSGASPLADVTVDSNAGGEDEADEGLVVSRAGKVVFRQPSGTSSPQDVMGGAIQPATEKEVTQAPRSISPQIAEQRLVNRVEPVYPEAARLGGTQGPVVLEVWVGREGAVQKITSVSGHPQLIAAATAAVRQWRFRPLYHEGQAEGFRTRVTVDFRLP
jgi:L-methionine (R)-S-oxide reductase